MSLMQEARTAAGRDPRLGNGQGPSPPLRLALPYSRTGLCFSESFCCFAAIADPCRLGRKQLAEKIVFVRRHRRDADRRNETGNSDRLIGDPSNFRDGLLPATPNMALLVEPVALSIARRHAGVMQRHDIPLVIEDR